MSLKSFFSGDGPAYRLTSSAPSALGQALLADANGVAEWGDVGGGVRDWGWREIVEVYSEQSPDSNPVGAVTVFTREETIRASIPNERLLPRQLVNTSGFSASGLGGLSSYLSFAIPGNRSPYLGSAMSVAATIQVNGAGPFVAAGAACLGQTGDVRVYLPAGTSSVSVMGITTSFIGTTAIPP